MLLANSKKWAGEVLWPRKVLYGRQWGEGITGAQQYTERCFEKCQAREALTSDPGILSEFSLVITKELQM
ncbi:hypothetical protein NL676_023183 [Syzygium grande]|nr:hypothetical protein NL676_023183 [Syzygium grande]